MRPGKEFWDEQYAALTEDFIPFGEAPKFSTDWVKHRLLQQERDYLLKQEAANRLGDIVTFTTVSMPLVRKIFSRLIAMDMVSVQPISQPTAKVFYLDFVFGEDKGDVSAGESIYTRRERSGVRAYADRTPETGTVQSLKLKLTDSDITAVEKALKAEWSLELEQDLMAYHGLAIEPELLAICQQEIVNEVDGMILYDMLAKASAGNVQWNTTGYLANDLTVTMYKKEYDKTLMDAFTDASNAIFKKRYRYGSWIIGHPDDVVRLEKMEDFKTVEGGVPEEFIIGRHQIGTLQGKWRVYKDPFWPTPKKFLMGYKGATWSDTVAFYAPYIPLYTTPLLVDPNTFTPRRGLMSRFAYGTLISDGLATIELTTS